MRTYIRRASYYKQMPCRECGNAVTVGLNKQKAPRCTDCGVKAYETAMLEIYRGSGPSFDRWLAGCLAKRSTGQRG